MTEEKLVSSCYVGKTVTIEQPIVFVICLPSIIFSTVFNHHWVWRLSRSRRSGNNNFTKHVYIQWLSTLEPNSLDFHVHVGCLESRNERHFVFFDMFLAALVTIIKLHFCFYGFGPLGPV